MEELKRWMAVGYDFAVEDPLGRFCEYDKAETRIRELEDELVGARHCIATLEKGGGEWVQTAERWRKRTEKAEAKLAEARRALIEQRQLWVLAAEDLKYAAATKGIIPFHELHDPIPEIELALKRIDADPQDAADEDTPGPDRPGLLLMESRDCVGVPGYNVDAMGKNIIKIYEWIARLEDTLENVQANLIGLRKNHEEDTQ